MSDGRLPAHIEVAGLIRAAEVAGGFGTVISRGERDAGVILVLTIERGRNARLWERMPRLDGSRAFEVVKQQDPENKREFEDYLKRRTDSDSDIWLVELDIPDPTRLIAEFAR